MLSRNLVNLKNNHNIARILCRVKFCRHLFAQSQLIKQFEVEYDPLIDLKIPAQYKKHPYKFNLKSVRVSDELEQAINKILSTHSVKPLFDEARQFVEFRKNRRLPFESSDYKRIEQEAHVDVDINDSLKLFMSPEEREMVEKNKDKDLKLRLRQRTYQWFPINYTERLAYTYLLAYFAEEYACLKQIFSEIERKDPDFKPTHLLDFGSGVGTVQWAANSIWKSDIKENFNVDISTHMNMISQSLIRYGIEGKHPILKGVTYRKSLPSSKKDKFELVTSAFSFFEIKNKRTRMEILKTLWNKVTPDGFLVLVEQSSVYGYDLIMEARDFILNKLTNNPTAEEEPTYAHVFSPCPHEFACPAKANNLKCTATANYVPLQVYGVKTSHKVYNSAYSYVVIKKSPRSQDTDKQFPRFVYRNPNKIKAAVHSYFCTKYGHIDHLISTKDRNKELYRFIKYSKVMDQLPGHYDDSMKLVEDNKAARAEYKKNKINRNQQNMEDNDSDYDENEEDNDDSDVDDDNKIQTNSNNNKEIE